MASALDTKNVVNIVVEGDVIGSTIIGIKGGGRSVETRDGLFRKVLFEYLGLPTLREIVTSIDLNVERSRDQVREYDFSRASALLRLWMAVLQDRYGFCEPHTFMLDAYDERGQQNKIAEWTRSEDPLYTGSWVQLRNVQLSSFVNRAPGKFFLGGWRFTYGHERAEDEKIVVSESMWTWEDYAVRTLGIGDVRLGLLDGFVLLSATCPGTASSSVTDAGGATLSPLGFPILVEESLYKKLKPTLDRCGAVIVEELFAQLAAAPTDTGLIWAPGVPKSCLLAVARRGRTTAAIPGRCYNAIWTVATNEDESGFHYCVWGFENGTADFRRNIGSAASLISQAMDKRHLRPIFEFDFEQNWFSESSNFGPAAITLLAKQIRSDNRLKSELSFSDIDAGADHMMSDMDIRLREDPEGLATLSAC